MRRVTRRKRRESHRNSHSMQQKACKIRRLSTNQFCTGRALAIHFDRVLATGRFQSQADLARAGQVTRARLTQILNLTRLAPDLQEKLLFLEPYTDGRAPLTERQIRPIAAESNWDKQRRLFDKLAGSANRSDQE